LSGGILALSASFYEANDVDRQMPYFASVAIFKLSVIGTKHIY